MKEQDKYRIRDYLSQNRCGIEEAAFFLHLNPKVVEGVVAAHRAKFVKVAFDGRDGWCWHYVGDPADPLDDAPAELLVDGLTVPETVAERVRVLTQVVVALTTLNLYGPNGLTGGQLDDLTTGLPRLKQQHVKAVAQEGQR